MKNSGLCKLILLNLLVIFQNAFIVDAAPSRSHSSKHHHSVRNVESEGSESSYHLIDEHQNGTDNYRISVKDIVVILVPPESLLSSAAAAGANLGINLLSRQSDLSTLDNLDEPSVSTAEPEEDSSDQKENEATTQKEEQKSEEKEESKDEQKEEPEQPVVDQAELPAQDFVQNGRAEVESHKYPAIIGPFLRRKVNRY